MPTVKETDDVIAIAAHRLMFMLRLTLVAALAGYMLPTVSYAMHGDVAASYAAQIPKADEHGAHSHAAGSTHSDHGDVAMDGQGRPAGHHDHTSKQDCCSNFCLNMAVVDDAPEFRAARAAPAHAFTNDLPVFAEPIELTRPPAFRT